MPDIDPELLMKSFDFTGADLSANAAGELTARQINRLQRRYSDLETYAFIFGVFPGALVALGMALLFIGTVRSEFILSRVLIVVGGGLLMTLWGGMFLIYRRYKDDLNEGRVMSFCGNIILDKGPLVHRIAIEAQLFTITRQEFDALVDRTAYCIYVTPRSRRVVSIRPLDQSSSITGAG